MTIRTKTSLMFALAAAGCGLGKSMTEDEFCKEYAKRECAKVADYCGFAASACEPVRLSSCQSMAAASKTGTRKFNADNAGKCLDQVTAAYATLPITGPKLQALDLACARVFSGTAKAMDSCTIDYDCADDLICDKSRCGGKKVVSSGGGCANVGEVCPTGEYCTNTSGLYVCTRKQGQGATCSDSQPCAEDLRCATTCAARVENGAACASDDECKSGYCNPYAEGQHKCATGLVFADESASCMAYKDPNAKLDAGTSD